MATGFPAGQTHLKTRLEEVRLAVADGASEIDIVINRTLALTGQWEGEGNILNQSGIPSPGNMVEAMIWYFCKKDCNAL